MPALDTAALDTTRTAMRAAMFYGGDDIRVEDVPKPEPGPGEALVAVAASGICGADLHRYRDFERWNRGRSVPYRAGHEFAGTVKAVGDEVDPALVGRRVAVEPVHLRGCGKCRRCRNGAYHLCPRRGLDGTVRRRSQGFAEYDLAPREQIFPIPEHLPFEVAALADVYACALHALHRVGVDAATDVAILGTGPIGLATGQIARTLGARRTVVVGRRDAALAQARELGAADETVRLDTADPDGARDAAEKVRELCGGEGAGAVFETVGGAATGTVALALAMAAPGGRLGIVGSFSGEASVAFDEAQRKEVDLRWSNSYATWCGEREFQLALDLLALGKVRAAPMVTHRFPLEDIAEAFSAAVDRRRSNAIKVMTLPQTGAPSS